MSVSAGLLSSGASLARRLFTHSCLLRPRECRVKGTTALEVLSKTHDPFDFFEPHRPVGGVAGRVVDQRVGGKLGTALRTRPGFVPAFEKRHARRRLPAALPTASPARCESSGRPLAYDRATGPSDGQNTPPTSCVNPGAMLAAWRRASQRWPASTLPPRTRMAAETTAPWSPRRMDRDRSETVCGCRTRR